MIIQPTRILVFVSIWFLIVSCKKEEKEAPVPDFPRINLRVDGSEDVEELTKDAGETIVISGTLQAKKLIGAFRGTITGENYYYELVNQAGDSISQELSIDSIVYVVDFATSGKSLDFWFYLTDLEGNIDSVSFQVNVKDSPILELTDIYMGGYGHAEHGNLLNVVDDTVYFPNNVKVLKENQIGVDMILTYGAGGWMLTSPQNPAAKEEWNSWSAALGIGPWPFEATSSTKFQLMDSSFSFSNVQTSLQLESLISSGSSSVSGFTAGSVIAFELDSKKESKLGIIDIQVVTGGKQDVRDILMQIKVQR